MIAHFAPPPTLGLRRARSCLAAQMGAFVVLKVRHDQNAREGKHADCQHC